MIGARQRKFFAQDLISLPLGNIIFSRNQQGDASYPSAANNARYLVGVLKFGFLDSGATNKIWGPDVACREGQSRPANPSSPAPVSSLHSSVPAVVWAVRRRRCGGRWVAEWGKGCGPKSCLTASLHGLDYSFQNYVSLTFLPGQHVLPQRTWVIWARHLAVRRDASHLKCLPETSIDHWAN